MDRPSSLGRPTMTDNSPPWRIAERRAVDPPGEPIVPVPSGLAPDQPFLVVRED